MKNSGFIIENGKLIEYIGNGKNVIIPDDVIIIGEGAFRNKDIESVTMNSVVKIEEHAFDSCEYLKNIIFSNALEEIDDYAFIFCTSLKDIYIPKSVKYLGNHAFSICNSENFKSLIIEDRKQNLICFSNAISVSSSKKPLEIILPSSYLIKKYDIYNLPIFEIEHSNIKYLEIDYFDIEFFKFYNVNFDDITVRIYDDEVYNNLISFKYHMNINTIIFESTDNLVKKNFIIQEITKERNRKERKQSKYSFYFKKYFN